ncbi:acyltransferase family protein [Streptomyces sp. NRRL B-3648]|uniref:acyltransferase family protein n=1 Tax=Streptomyces sp. NRRL B-3648 TaxID=1519493 RepID=UPI0006ADEFD4|nr:acyltransferase [Streptomyces sp. NRRL B-3648]KOX07581.1 acyltransferase [Streptomyces sp. NRRL B-3648]
MPSNSPPAPRPKLPSLTGLRFIAAALVFFFHASLIFISMNPFADPDLADGFRWLFSKAGWMGVSFFFVLSGFVLTWSARPGDTVTGFWRRRLLKIFPNHAVTWALAMLLFAGSAVPVKVWLPNLFLVHSWFPDPAVHLSLNAPAWSLCSELLFYLLFPFLLRPVLRIKERALWVWAAAMVAGMLAVQLVTDFLAPGSPAAPGTDVTVWQFWFGYNFPPVRMFEFVLGMILARLVLAGAFPRIAIVPAAVLCLAGYAAAMAVPFLYGLNLMTVVPISLLICAVAYADVEGTRTVLRGRAMQWLGEVSFGFYLAQQIVLSFVRTKLMDERTVATPVGIAVVATEFAGALALGWLLLVCVERPVMRRWARPRRRTAEPAESSAAPQQLTTAS